MINKIFMGLFSIFKKKKESNIEDTAWPSDWINDDVIEGHKNHLKFLKRKYSWWSSSQKARYQIGQILFQDRMQGGFPSGYKNPAATYFSKWFVDEYGQYDRNIILTIELIAKEFDVDTMYLKEMVKYNTDSDEWKDYANKLNLIGEREY